MGVSEAVHEKLAERLASILQRLHRGDSVSREELAEEFQVSERTIYRDLHERLSNIVDPLPDGRYQLADPYRGRLSSCDLQTLARLLGAEQLFPGDARRALLGLLDSVCRDALTVRGHRYENLAEHEQQFGQLGDAIRKHRFVHFRYGGKDRMLAPYRMINQNGIWYLAAAEENTRLKAFSLSRISELRIDAQTFTPSDAIHAQIDSEGDIWFNNDKFDVLLAIAPQAAYYFRRRALLPEQHLAGEQEDGGLTVRSRISHANQLLPIVRYWLPSVRIIEPAWLRETLEHELMQYLGRDVAIPEAS